MKKTIISLGISAAIFGTLSRLASPAFAAGIPVFDGVAAAKWVEQIRSMKGQLDIARGQLAEAKRMYESVTGGRGFGDLMRNPELRQFLPQDVAQLYGAVQGGSFEGISGSVQDILKAESTSESSVANILTAIDHRQHIAAATDKAVGLQGYEGAKRRLDQIEALTDQIDNTMDQKAIAELAARISAEKAAIQNETTKLQMLSMLQDAEQKLIAVQKHEVSRKILNPANTGMPVIK